jgi:hypothetical protein
MLTIRMGRTRGPLRAPSRRIPGPQTSPAQVLPVSRCAPTAVSLALLYGAAVLMTSSIVMIAAFTTNWYAFRNSALLAPPPDFQLQHKRPRPKKIRVLQGGGRSQDSASRQQQQRQEITGVVGASMTSSATTSWLTMSTRTPAVTVPVQCHNCHATVTSSWHKDDEGRTVCTSYVPRFPPQLEYI